MEKEMKKTGKWYEATVRWDKEKKKWEIERVKIDNPMDYIAV